MTNSNYWFWKRWLLLMMKAKWDMQISGMGANQNKRELLKIKNRGGRSELDIYKEHSGSITITNTAFSPCSTLLDYINCSIYEIRNMLFCDQSTIINHKKHPQSHSFCLLFFLPCNLPTHSHFAILLEKAPNSVAYHRKKWTHLQAPIYFLLRKYPKN